MTDFADILNEDDDETPSVETPTVAEPSEVPAVAESPAPEPIASNDTPAPVAEEAQPVTREDGAIWSDKAKRWYLDGKIVAGEAPVPPSEPSIPSVPAVAPVVEAPKVEAPTGEPWTVRGGGGKHAIPGAVLTADGKLVVEGPENIARHRDIVAAGIQHLTNYGREKQEWTQRIQQAEARGEASAAKYNKASVYLFDKLSGFLAEHPQELDLIRRELAIELKSADLEIPRNAQAAEPAPEQIEQAFAQTMGGYLDELLDDAPKGVLTAEDISDIKATFGRRMAAYAAEIDGQIVLDTHAMKADFEREVRLAQRSASTANEARKQAEKAKAAAAFNAANAPKVTAVPPRKPTPKPAHAAAPSGQKPSWDQAVKSAWNEDDDE